MGRKEITETHGRHSSRTVGAAEGIYTGEKKDRIGGQAETTDGGEGMGVVAEEWKYNQLNTSPRQTAVQKNSNHDRGRCV